VPPGAALDEMARRELLEEAGGQAESLEEVAAFYTMPGIGTEKAHVFLARGVTLGEPRREASEAMERHLLPVEEALRMAAGGEIEDGVSALALLLCAPRINRNEPDETRE
jgi:ADP-ribose pyrophosphatase